MSDMTMAVIGRRESAGVVSAAELLQWLEYGPAPMIVDLRSPEAYREHHLPEAENVPMTNAAELVRRIPDDGLVVFVCEDGILSREVVRMLGFCGFRQVASLDGGMRGWTSIARRAAA